MYFFSMGAQGHFESAWPGSSGAPMECRQGMNFQSVPSCYMTFVTTRVMMCMFITTYGESVT